jgi:hypothetical protein
MLRRLLVAIVVFQVALSTGLLWRHFAAGTESRPLDRVALPNGEPLTIESAPTAADPAAHAWNVNATLFAASMQLAWSNAAGTAAPGERGWILLTYRAGHETLGLLIERTSGAVISRSVEQWPETPTKTLSTSGLRIDSSLVVLASDLAGGDDFRNACPAYHTVSRVSLSERDGKHVWVVTYDDSRQLGNPLWRMITDAQTGDVIETNDWSASGPAC